MLVNGACTVIEQADHMLAGHTTLVEEWVRARRDTYGWVPRVHAGCLVRNRGQYNKQYPSVTDWWENVSSGATSAGKAALIGMRMGFERIILCGCPMDGGGYVTGEAVVPHDPGCLRVGLDKNKDKKIIRRYKERMAELAAGEFRGKVFSMSGFTREVLGAP